MIHLILVSHHPDIARGIAALAAQMSAAPDTIHTAAGIDDADNPVGTDAVRIMQAILDADNPDGILILVDLGSAILSAQTALDLLDDPALAARCRISAAPLVEGAISAAVAASSGADLETVAREATQALAAKQAALGESAPASATPVVAPSGDSTTITLTNRDGLHARPAARLVAALTPYRARLILTCGDKQADGKSLNQLALLQARHGDRLTLHADGDDAAAALQTFRELAATNFGDPPDSGDGHLLACATPRSTTPAPCTPTAPPSARPLPLSPPASKPCKTKSPPASARTQATSSPRTHNCSPNWQKPPSRTPPPITHPSGKKKPRKPPSRWPPCLTPTCAPAPPTSTTSHNKCWRCWRTRPKPPCRITRPSSSSPATSTRCAPPPCPQTASPLSLPTATRTATPRCFARRHNARTTAARAMPSLRSPTARTSRLPAPAAKFTACRRGC